MAAVDDVSFDVERGDIVGLLGPNGAGKSTIMRILAGYLPPTGGQVRVAGLDVLAESLAARARIGYLPESVPLYPEMRVDEYLKYRSRIKRVRPRRRRQAIAEVKERCGLHDMGRVLIGGLSRGYRQRVGLADALVHNPDVLILDEPTLGLDPEQNRQVRALIRELAHRHTVLWCSHVLSEVESTCDRVLILKQGRVVAAGAPDDLRRASGAGLRYRAEIRGPAAAVEPWLRSWPVWRDVSVRPDGEWLVCRMAGVDGEDRRAELVAGVTGRGWGLREVGCERASLEDLYLGLAGTAAGAGTGVS